MGVVRNEEGGEQGARRGAGMKIRRGSVICVAAVLAYVALVLGVSACTDADMAHMSQFNDPADVVCYSGAQVIYRGSSTGKIQSNKEEDGLYFKEKGSGKFVRLYADCIVTSR